MATAVFAETLGNFEHSTRFIPESRSCKLDFKFSYLLTEDHTRLILYNKLIMGGISYFSYNFICTIGYFKLNLLTDYFSSILNRYYYIRFPFDVKAVKDNSFLQKTDTSFLFLHSSHFVPCISSLYASYSLFRH
jgi:hypothetical protein